MKEDTQTGKLERVIAIQLLNVDMLSLEQKAPRKKNPFHLKTRISKIVIFIIMENKNLKWLLSQIQQDQNFINQLKLIQQNYPVKIYKISQLTCTNVEELYITMQKKFYLNRKVSNEECWYQNQLRLFVWSLFAYLHINHKQIINLNEEDWKFFSIVFNFKSTVFFEFQAHSLIRPQGKPALWQQQQSQLFLTIIKLKNFKNRWNSIARELFLRSNKKYFRNPKQCRQRWINHLDPSKIHTKWMASQDLLLLNCIKKNGKRWSIAVKQLSNTRTEHMVKNRYKSLISNQAKKYPEKRQCDIETILIKKLSKTQEKIIKQSPKLNQIESSREIVTKVEKHTQNLIKVEETQLLKQKNEQFNQKKQEVKYQAEIQEVCYFDQLDNQLNQFEAHSPMFIAWNLQGYDHRFPNQIKFKMQEKFCCHQSSQNFEYQKF